MREDQAALVRLLVDGIAATRKVKGATDTGTVAPPPSSSPWKEKAVVLKALISTGIVLPNKSILFSVGVLKETVELLPSVQELRAAGYNIIATSGTSDFLASTAFPVRYGVSKSEYFR